MPAAGKPLRAVGTGERSKPAKPLTLTQAAEVGDTRAILAAMRQRLAKAMDDPGVAPRELVGLSSRLTEVIRDLAALNAEQAEPTAEQETAPRAAVVDDALDASSL